MSRVNLGKASKKITEESVTFSALGGGGSRRSHSLGEFVAAEKPFVNLKEAPKQTLCSLLTSDMLDMASISMFKISCTISGASVGVSRTQGNTL